MWRHKHDVTRADALRSDLGKAAEPVSCRPPPGTVRRSRLRKYICSCFRFSDWSPSTSWRSRVRYGFIVRNEPEFNSRNLKWWWHTALKRRVSCIFRHPWYNRDPPLTVRLYRPSFHTENDLELSPEPSSSEGMRPIFAHTHRRSIRRQPLTPTPYRFELSSFGHNITWHCFYPIYILRFILKRNAISYIIGGALFFSMRAHPPLTPLPIISFNPR